MSAVTRSQFLKAIDLRDWTFTIAGRTFYTTVTFDDYVNAILRDEFIELTPALLSQLEISLRGRPSTLTNLRRLSA